MFGNRKNKFEERRKEIFAKISEQRETFENGVAKIEEGSASVLTDVCQVMENTEQMTAHAGWNREEESLLIQSIDAVSEDVQTAVSEYMQLKELVEQQMEAIEKLVDENKHFTTPAKQLNEAPSVMRQKLYSYEKQLAEIGSLGKELGAFAKQSSEDAIAQKALAFEHTTDRMQQDVRDSQKKVLELEETIHRLVALLKESNMGTARLLQKGQKITALLQSSGMRDFSEDMVLMRDKVVAMRNLDEEIEKCAQRNQIQLTDIKEEVQTKKMSLAELESDISHLFDSAEEQLH